ncbi:hypothetical protein IXO278_18000, partial [Xanthomonas oryzae pv. oryzae]
MKAPVEKTHSAPAPDHRKRAHQGADGPGGTQTATRLAPTPPPCPYSHQPLPTKRTPVSLHD